VNHRLAARLETEFGLVRVLEDVQQRTTRAIQPIGLLDKPSAIRLIVDKDVLHRFALIAEALVRFIEVADQVKQRATAFFAFANALFHRRELFSQRGVLVDQIEARII
jgi:hypothetical protein